MVKMMLPSTRELNFHFTAGSKKGSKIDAKIKFLGFPNPNYTHFGTPFGRNGFPKRGVKKRLLF